MGASHVAGVQWGQNAKTVVCKRRESNTDLHLISHWKGGILTIGPRKLSCFGDNDLL